MIQPMSYDSCCQPLHCTCSLLYYAVYWFTMYCTCWVCHELCMCYVMCLKYCMKLLYFLISYFDIPYNCAVMDNQSHTMLYKYF